MISLQDAKARFSALVDAALAGRPQEVSRRGKPAVVIVSSSEYRRLVREAQAKRPGFVDHLLDFPGEDFDRAEVRPRDVDL